MEYARRILIEFKGMLLPKGSFMSERTLEKIEPVETQRPIKEEGKMMERVEKRGITATDDSRDEVSEDGLELTPCRKKGTQGSFCNSSVIFSTISRRSRKSAKVMVRLCAISFLESLVEFKYFASNFKDFC